MTIFIAKSDDGDWKGLYVDGKCVDQGHSLDVWDVLCAVKDNGTPVESLASTEYTSEQMDELGNHFPGSLEELVKQTVTA